MYFNIEIAYSTGNSFSREDTIDTLDVVTTDLSKAQENLQRVKQSCIDYKKDSRDINPVMFLTDNGEQQIQPFWLGYFESLQEAKIIIELGNSPSDYMFTYLDI